MRAKDRAEVADLVRKQLAPMNDYMAKLMAALAGVSNEIMGAVEQIKPATVDLTQEMADDIVRKIHGPLTIGKGFSDWIKGEAQVRDIFWVTQVGYGQYAGQMHLILKTNGTLDLQIRDHLGATMWHGTFVPPDFGVSNDPG